MALGGSTAASIAAATQGLRGLGRGQGMPGINSNYGTSAWGGEGLTLGAPAGQATGIGTQPQTITDASTQFDDGTVQAAQGIHGNINARQASLGSAGMMALKKHLSPVNNGTEMSDSEKKLMHQTQSMTDKAIYGQDYEGQHGTVITTSKSLNAYKSPNPPYDPNSGDDGAGGKTYETN